MGIKLQRLPIELQLQVRNEQLSSIFASNVVSLNALFHVTLVSSRWKYLESRYVVPFCIA